MKAAARLVPLAGAAVLAAALRPRLRDWHLHWGATAAEAEGRLPGDELLVRADIVSTRAIAVAAPPAAVWPWLVQMGPGRGGAYSYDWVENLLGLGMRSADRIHPEWQHLELGDTPSVRPGAEPGPDAMRVRILEPERALVTADDRGRWVWAFVLVPDGAGSRLISRNRIVAGRTLAARLAMAVMSPGSWVMERKMLLGIKERAERAARQTALRAPSPFASRTR